MYIIVDFIATFLRDSIDFLHTSMIHSDIHTKTCLSDGYRFLSVLIFYFILLALQFHFDFNVFLSRFDFQSFSLLHVIFFFHFSLSSLQRKKRRTPSAFNAPRSNSEGFMWIHRRCTFRLFSLLLIENQNDLQDKKNTFTTLVCICVA